MLKKIVNKFKYWMDYNPPASMSSKGWRLFKKEFKEVAPVRYWFKHEFRYFILPIKWKCETIRNWIRYRTYDRYHIVDTGLTPGYYDPLTTMLHVNFNIMKDFVEVEQAWHSYMWSDDWKTQASWYEKHMPFYRFFYPFRRPDLGIKHLEWASTLDDPSLPPHERCDSQAQHARELLIIYKWWVHDRPARKKIDYPEYSDQGLDGLLACFDADFDQTAPDFVAHRAAMDKGIDQDELWEKEDEEFLIRLMKIRRGLWT
jgi:hypothetical protein